jgi:hypothetical protein
VDKDQLKAKVEALRKKAFKNEPGKPPSIDPDAHAEWKEATARLGDAEREEMRTRICETAQREKAEREKQQMVFQAMQRCYSGDSF